jgi:hypothetical protein
MERLITFLAKAGLNDPFPHVEASSSTLSSILSLVFAATGSLAVLFIVIGGFRYIISGGDPQDAAQAKNTIIYAVVGLIVSIAAWAIVSFVLKQL